MLVRELLDGDPRRVGPYVLSGRLGEGGMGVVYGGADSTGRRAAIKVIHPQLARDHSFLQRFGREAQLLARVEGPFTARVLTADASGDPAYLAMEYIDGPTLAQYVAQLGPLPTQAVIPLAVGLLGALQAVHAVGVVHRDLKPANVIMSPSGPRVIDFGIAHLADGTAMTTTGIAIGSPGWMAPEQLAADRAGPASDVFAWAATVAYAATGRPPFGGGRLEGVYYRVLNADPDLERLDPQLAGTLLEAMSKEPSGRPRVDALIRQLSPLLNDESADMAAQVAAQWTATVPVRAWPAQGPTRPATSIDRPVTRQAAAAAGTSRSRGRSVGIAAAAAAALVIAAGGVAVALASLPDEPRTPVAASTTTPYPSATTPSAAPSATPTSSPTQKATTPAPPPAPARAAPTPDQDERSWPADREVLGAVKGDQDPPQFPAKLDGYDLVDTTRDSVRAFEGTQWSLVYEYPHTMNGCDQQRFLIRWRALNDSAIVEATHGYEPNTEGLAEPPVAGPAGWISTFGCSQPGFRLASARDGSTLTDVTLEIQYYEPAV